MLARTPSPEESDTLPEAIEKRAVAGGGELVFHLAEGTTVLSAADVAREAESRARSLLSLGVGPGERVGVLGPNSPDWAIWAASVWRLGATLFPLPYPWLTTAESLSQQLAAMTAAVDCRLVLAHPDMLASVPEQLRVAWNDVPAGHGRVPSTPSPDDLAVIQLTSGSTAAPKGVMLSHRSVLTALQSATESSALRRGHDRLVGWLPFFHDYGLFGFMARPLVMGLDVHILPTERFAEDPALWWRLIGSVGATFTAGPASAWAMTARSLEASSEGVDLRTLRGCVMAAETINVDTVERVRAVGGRFGLRPEAISGAYGLAEATLGVTGMPMGSGMRIDEIDTERFAGAGEAVPARDGPVKRVASCGRPMKGIEIRVVGPGGDLPTRKVGEVHVRGPSLMRGYIGAQGPDPFVDGWLRTGDLGYVAEGELFITGRVKDIIILMGRNYAAEDLEWAAATVPGVRPGRCVAFSRPNVSDGEAVLLVESRQGADVRKLARSVRMAVATQVGAIPLEVVVLPPGTIEKTTSGKLRRSAMRDAYAGGSLKPLVQDAPR